jgi:homoserine kinase
MSLKQARAFAPATVANVAVGFDILGFAIGGLGEEALVQKVENSREVVLDPVKGYPQLPLVPAENTATAGLLQLIEDKKLSFGFRVQLKKTIPIGSGLGGSSLSAVATIVAANALLPKKLSREELLHYALIGEKVASGSIHADNIGPCLEGGLVFVRTHPQISVVKIKIPPALSTSLRCVILLPALTIHTKSAREILKPQVSLSTVIEQTGNLAGFLLGCTSGKVDLIRQSLRDVLIEPQRSVLIPHFSALQGAALEAGALGCSISGSGPAIFALAATQTAAEKIKKNMVAMAKKRGLALQGSWVSPLSKKGAHVLDGKRKG